MRKANKSKLTKVLKKNVFSNSYQVDQSFHVLDGGALLHKMASKHFILNQYSRYVKSRYDRACIVFDGYDNGPCTKDHEHQRRAGKMAAYVRLQDLQMIPTCNQEILLKNDPNIVQFISILSEELRREGHDVRNSTGDADTQILSAALEYAGDIDNDIVVVASDADILVLLMFHWKEGMNIYMLAETPNKKVVDREFWKIENLVKEAGAVITSHILFIHDWSGCDTTSAIYGQGK